MLQNYRERDGVRTFEQPYDWVLF